jgi:hypothetical protein
MINVVPCTLSNVVKSNLDHIIVPQIYPLSFAIELEISGDESNYWHD